MPDRATSGPRTRVVVFSPDMAVFGEDSRSAGDLRAGGIDLIRVTSAYEAVAEMLCEPAAGFVIDLRLLGTGGLGSLEIARQRGVEMLATGMVPSGLTAEDLSGVRLLARRDLPAAVRNLAALPAVSPVEPPVSQPAEPPAVSPDPVGTEPPEGTYVPEPPVVSPDPVEIEPAEGATDEPATTRAAAESILTPEELTALLESDL